MFDRIAKIIADEVVERVLPAIHKEVIDNIIPKAEEYLRASVSETQALLQKAADDAVVNAFAALDLNKDGKIDLNDLFKR